MSTAYKRSYLIDGILPASGLHLIAGPSGAGKTTWQFQMLQEFVSGAPVLGHTSHPGPIFYIAADRDEDEVHETLERVGVPIDLFPTVSLLDMSVGIESALNMVPRGTALVVIEGIASLVEDGRISDYRTVAEFIKTARRASKIHGYSILGSVHATKTKEGERFENPRQRILGSVAWAAFSGNVILIEPDKPKSVTDGGRTLLILPRNAPQEEHRFQLDERGRFVPAVGAPEEAKRLLLLSRLPNITPFTRAEALHVAEDMGIPDRTLDRWLKGLVSDGYITKVDGREYIRAVPAMEGGNLLGIKKLELTEKNSADAADHLEQ